MKSFIILNCLFFATLLAQESNPQKGKTPVASDYFEAISWYDSWSKNISNPKIYSEIELEVKDGENSTKKVKFENLPSLQKDVFYLYQAEKCTNNLLRLEKIWSAELSNLRQMSEDQRKEFYKKHRHLPPPQRPPSVETLKKCTEALLQLRKDHAQRYEALIDSVFEKHEESIPEKDRKAYKRRVHKWHDRQSLIDRNQQ